MSEESTILEERTREVVHHWWWGAAHDRDVYELFVVEYIVVDGKPTNEQRFLDRFGIWNDSAPGATVAPCLSITGVLAHVLGAEGAIELKRSDIAEVFIQLTQRLLRSAGKL